MLVFVEEENPEKIQQQGENQQQTQPSCIICFSWFSFERCEGKRGINSGISYLERYLSSKDQFILFEQSSCGVNEHWKRDAVDQVVHSEFHFFCRFSFVDSLLKHYIECLKNGNKNTDMKFFFYQNRGMRGNADNISCTRIPVQKLFHLMFALFCPVA